MSTLTIVGTGTDSLGVTASYTVLVTNDSFAIQPTVTPQVAQPGTTRTLTLTPVGGVAPFTWPTPQAPNTTFTPIAGQSNAWTFVF